MALEIEGEGGEEWREEKRGGRGLSRHFPSAAASHTSKMATR